MNDDPRHAVRIPLKDQALIVISGVQVRDTYNRIYAAACGAYDVAWPVAYKHSIPGKCVNCDGNVLLGPEIIRLRDNQIRDGKPGDVHCLLCAVLIFGEDITFMPLTDKKLGELWVSRVARWTRR